MDPPPVESAVVDVPASAAADDVAALVASVRSRAGETESQRGWAGLYERFAPVVHGVLLARGVKPRAEAEDLTHDVFIDAMRRVGTLRDDGAIGGWLTAMARNAAAEWGRSGARRKGWVLRLAGRTTKASEERGVGIGEKTEEAERVLAVILSLPEAYHETMVLRLVEGLTGPQIAASLGMTHGSVRVNLVRGMAMLKERMVGEGECKGVRSGD